MEAISNQTAFLCAVITMSVFNFIFMPLGNGDGKITRYHAGNFKRSLTEQFYD